MKFTQANHVKLPEGRPSSAHSWTAHHKKVSLSGGGVDARVLGDSRRLPKAKKKHVRIFLKLTLHWIFCCDTFPSGIEIYTIYKW